MSLVNYLTLSDRDKATTHVVFHPPIFHERMCGECQLGNDGTITEVGNRSGKAVEQSDCFTHCLSNKVSSYFLILFYYFLDQSRYADVKELVSVKSRRPRCVKYIKLDRICQIID